MNVSKLNISNKIINYPSTEICSKLLKEEIKNFDNLGYDVFKISYKKSKLKMGDIVKECTQENKLGSGSNCIGVFKFNHELLKNWVIKLYKYHSDTMKKGLYRVKDDLNGFNFGQEIAKIDNNIGILKCSQGKIISFPDWSKRMKNFFLLKISEDEKKSYLNDLETISNFPQSSYINYAKKLKKIDENGYKADSFNPNNYLLDVENQEINIIDSYKYIPDMHRNTVYDMFCPIIDYFNYDKYYLSMDNKEKENLINKTHIIFKKCYEAAKEIGVSLSEKTFIEFIKDVDDRLDTSYHEHYLRMKKLAGLV